MKHAEIKILENIISSNGCCDDMRAVDCAICPLGKLVKNMGCLEALGVERLNNREDIDLVYFEAAARKLADMKLEEILEEDSIVK